MTSLALYSPSGLLTRAAPLRRASRRLGALGFEVEIDSAALAKHQRFAGDDATRLAAIHRVATRAPAIAMATRGARTRVETTVAIALAVSWKPLM